MKKEKIRISNPDEFNKHLQYTSPFVWIILVLVIGVLASFFAWSFLAKLEVKLTGKAVITSGDVTLQINNSDISKLKVGQKVYINDKQGEILSVENSSPVVSTIDLSDGEYDYKVVIGETRPIDFLLSK